MTGTLIVRENNFMSLSCVFEAEIENGIVKDITRHGYPRACGDLWFHAAKDLKIGDAFTQDRIDWYITFNGKNNVRATFKSHAIIQQQVEVGNLPTCNRPAQCAKGMGEKCYSGLDCPDKGVATTWINHGEEK